MGNHDSPQAAERGSVGFRTELGSWASIRVLWIGSWRTTRRAAMYSLIVTAKMNGVDPQAWLADVLARIASHPAHRLQPPNPRRLRSPSPTPPPSPPVT